MVDVLYYFYYGMELMVDSSLEYDKKPKNRAIHILLQDVLKILEDVEILQPTTLAGVPRLFQKIYDKVNTEVQRANFLRRSLYNRALKSKMNAIKNDEEPNSMWESLVFNKIKQKFGGNLEMVFSGSAPLSAKTADWMKAYA